MLTTSASLGPVHWSILNAVFNIIMKLYIKVNKVELMVRIEALMHCHLFAYGGMSVIEFAI